MEKENHKGYSPIFNKNACKYTACYCEENIYWLC